MATWSSAAALHVVWAVALATTLALPVVVRFAPVWRVTPVSSDWMSRAGAVFDRTWRGDRRRADSEVWPVLPGSPSHAPFTKDTGALARASTNLDITSRSRW